ncbi:MAG: hypothetical protein ACAI34_00875 [Verrucomicrobium sp.]|nr:hypothetical protein [Verrucomicrobium sp.]
MKILLAVVGGALLGAAGVYLGLTQQLLVVGSGNGGQRLVQVNRFTGDAKEVFVSSFDANRAYVAEDVKSAAAEAAAESAKPQEPNTENLKLAPWAQLAKEEVDKLQIRFRYTSNRYYATWHNHLDKKVRIELIRAESPAAEGREALDRTYKVEWDTSALQDGSRYLEASLGEFPEGSIKFTPVKVLIGQE